MDKFGYSESDWAKAKAQTRKALIRSAKRDQDICYSDLVPLIEAIAFEPHDVRLFHLLGEISTDEHNSSRPLLSVMVVHKTGDREPGPGFFELSSQLGYAISDRVIFRVSERTRAVDYWKNH